MALNLIYHNHVSYQCLYYLVFYKLVFIYLFSYIKGNFCGNIYCDEFWGCKNKSNEAKLFVLDGMLYCILIYYKSRLKFLNDRY
jgi:hypothetical protein